MERNLEFMVDRPDAVMSQFVALITPGSTLSTNGSDISNPGVTFCSRLNSLSTEAGYVRRPFTVNVKSMGNSTGTQQSTNNGSVRADAVTSQLADELCAVWML
jgi:prophage tail gpP-like protein